MYKLWGGRNMNSMGVQQWIVQAKGIEKKLHGVPSFLSTAKEKYNLPAMPFLSEVTTCWLHSIR